MRRSFQFLGSERGFFLWFTPDDHFIMNSRRTRPARRVSWLHGLWNSLVLRGKTEILRVSLCQICFFFFSSPIRKGEISHLAVSTNTIVWLSYAGQKVPFKDKCIPERLNRISLQLYFWDTGLVGSDWTPPAGLGRSALVFVFLSKYFTNVLAAVATCAPLPGAAGRFVVELSGLCCSGVVAVDTRCAKIRGLALIAWLV